MEFKKAAVVLAVSLGAYVSARVAAGGYDIALVGLWLTSILVFCGAWFDGRLIILDRGKIRIWLGIGLLALLPVIVRVSLFDMSRIHGDDVISAWISATTDFSTANFFGGFPLSKVDWMGQFPAVYFVIQRGIVEVLGRNMAAIKWSVQPYVWLVGWEKRGDCNSCAVRVFLAGNISGDIGTAFCVQHSGVFIVSAPVAVVFEAADEPKCCGDGNADRGRTAFLYQLLYSRANGGIDVIEKA